MVSVPAVPTCEDAPARYGLLDRVGAAQQARISAPVSATRRGSRPHIPRPFATPGRKLRHVAHEVVERWHTQQRAASACGVEQWGHRQTGMRGS